MNIDDLGDRSGFGNPESGPTRAFLVTLQRFTEAGVWAYDGADNEMWWSDRAKEILRVDPRTELDFDGIIDCFVLSDQSRTKQLFTATLEANEPFETVIELAVEGTTERHVRLCAEPRRQDQKSPTIYGVVQDVTDAKRQERRIEVLGRTSQQLREANSRQDVATIMAETSKNILGYVNTTVRLVDTHEQILRTVVATEECLERAGERPDYSVDEETPAARTYRTGDPELHTDHNATKDGRDRGELRSGLYVPIGEYGVLSAGDVVVDAFGEQDIEAADLLGELGAKAITRIEWTKRSRAV